MDLKIGTEPRIRASLKASPKWVSLVREFPEIPAPLLEDWAVEVHRIVVFAMVDDSDASGETVLLVRMPPEDTLPLVLAHEAVHVALLRLGMPDECRAMDGLWVESMVDEWIGLRRFKYPQVPWSGEE